MHMRYSMGIVCGHSLRLVLHGEGRVIIPQTTDVDEIFFHLGCLRGFYREELERGFYTSAL